MDPQTGPAPVDILVTVADDHAPSAVAARLREAGMEVTEVLEALGTISGRAPAADAPRLALLEGVSAVEPARRVKALDRTPGDGPAGGKGIESC